jgi:hypothetical protein
MRSLVKSVTWLFGIVFILIGIAGFFVDGMLIVFQVDTLHNVVHLLSGIVALAAVGAGESYARLYLIVFGLVYALVTVVGFVNGGDILGLFETNAADNYLHAAIALVTLGVGFGGGKK